MTGRDTVAAFVDDDPRAAALLRQSLAALRDRLAGDPAMAGLRRDVAAVLEGRLDLRELARQPEFASIAEAGMREVQAAWEALPAEERARQVSAGRGLDAERP